MVGRGCTYASSAFPLLLKEKNVTKVIMVKGDGGCTYCASAFRLLSKVSTCVRRRETRA